MTGETVPALDAPRLTKDNPLTRSFAGVVGMVFLALMIIVCLGTLPWTTARVTETVVDEYGNPVVVEGPARYNAGNPDVSARLSPSWWPIKDEEEILRLNRTIDAPVAVRIAEAEGVPVEDLLATTSGPRLDLLAPHWDEPILGTDTLGRSLLIRTLTGGGISLSIGIAAALLSVFIGTIYGALAAFAGGKVDAVMMRIVDILFGLPYILLVVLLAVASDAWIDEHITRSKARGRWTEARLQELRAPEQSVEAIAASPPGGDELRAIVRGVLERDASAQISAAQVSELVRSHETTRALLDEVARLRFPERQLSESKRTMLDVIVLLVAIGGVSWLTMARVIRGQVLSLKAQPFMEAARAMGAPVPRQLLRHVLPNLVGPIVVYATLTVPQAILQESFLSFLGIGVKPPLPSWGNLAAEGLRELNRYHSNWWLLLFPCLLLAATLLALNFVGEGLREAFDPKRSRR
jgi:ABC-type dipeptide/oligopeptide/nickel transport system permease subunit